MAQIRAKEARAELYVNGIRLGGSFSTIHDISVKPDVTLSKKRFTGQARAAGDLDVMGMDVSFKTEKQDTIWSDLWQQIQNAEENGLDMPEIEMVMTYAYRGVAGVVSTITLHGDMVLKMDEDSVPQTGYQGNSWTGFCAWATPT